MSGWRVSRILNRYAKVIVPAPPAARKMSPAGTPAVVNSAAGIAGDMAERIADHSCTNSSTCERSNEMFCESFNDKVIEHFMSPRNVGSMPDASAEGTCGDPACGDSLTLFIKVKENRIEDISFLVFGCVAAIATSSMTTELVKGKTLEEALKLTDMDITNALGGLPGKQAALFCAWGDCA